MTIMVTPTIYFTPTTAGRYYVAIRWYQDYEDPDCGLTYDFVINRDVHLVHLP
jgi:hypothetical protein